MPPDTHHIATTVDLASVLVVIGVFFQFLPSVSALFTLVWMAIRIYETDTIQKMLGRTPISAEDKKED